MHTYKVLPVGSTRVFYQINKNNHDIVEIFENYVLNLPAKKKERKEKKRKNNSQIQNKYNFSW